MLFSTSYLLQEKTNVNVPRKQYEVINSSIVAYVVIYTKRLRDLDSTLVKVARGLWGGIWVIGKYWLEP